MTSKSVNFVPRPVRRLSGKSFIHKALADPFVQTAWKISTNSLGLYSSPGSGQSSVELVTDYFEGALSPVDRGRFEQHIAKCDWCKTYLDQMQLTIKTLGKLTEESIPPRARRELLAAFRTWK